MERESSSGTEGGLGVEGVEEEVEEVEDPPAAGTLQPVTSSSVSHRRSTNAGSFLHPTSTTGPKTGTSV